MFQQIRAVAQYSYKILKLDSDNAANMLYCNGRLVHRSRNEIGDQCYSVSSKSLTQYVYCYKEKYCSFNHQLLHM